MENPRDIRRRIKSISSTAQITRAMQMVAASKMKKIQQAALRGRPFVKQLYIFQRAATRRLVDFHHPLLEVREVRKRCVILIGADKGLCGPLNTNLFRLAGQFDPDTTVFIAAGRKAAQFLARTRRNLIAEFPYADMPRFPEARAIASFACDLFLRREVDEVVICATRFINTLSQVPLILEYLPVGEIKGIKIPGIELSEDVDTSSVLFEPDRQDLMNFLLTHYVNIFIFQVLLNAKASEQSARMVSMKNATDSAETLIHDLTLEYNRIRQGNITQEMLEIAGGAAD
jgi:F-type H+-transporting ATPase subunit gamma